MSYDQERAQLGAVRTRFNTLLDQVRAEFNGRLDDVAAALDAAAAIPARQPTDPTGNDDEYLRVVEIRGAEETTARGRLQDAMQGISDLQQSQALATMRNDLEFLKAATWPQPAPPPPPG